MEKVFSVLQLLLLVFIMFLNLKEDVFLPSPQHPTQKHHYPALPKIHLPRSPCHNQQFHHRQLLSPPFTLKLYHSQNLASWNKVKLTPESSHQLCYFKDYSTDRTTIEVDHYTTHGVSTITTTNISTSLTVEEATEWVSSNIEHGIWINVKPQGKSPRFSPLLREGNQSSDQVSNSFEQLVPRFSPLLMASRFSLPLSITGTKKARASEQPLSASDWLSITCDGEVLKAATVVTYVSGYSKSHTFNTSPAHKPMEKVKTSEVKINLLVETYESSWFSCILLRVWLYMAKAFICYVICPSTVGNYAIMYVLMFK